jgi:hypothetical protein
LDYTKLTKEIAIEVSSMEDLPEREVAELIAEKYPQLKIKQKYVNLSLGYILKREAYFILKEEENGKD